ncbi:calcium-binding mitochondrial carrier protein s -2 isoform x2 [Limosa lapponica baueri]|uniref:Calcium-binding mitochondrial carrier protein s-2 isoform x2 n=1 Tax=Limosa lapponica baueri TaxID=1758121 RepID=A0A2I0TS80_LIMLA|nr:calcium-binding mitochondrial carrier protein s -2 isoform x2 [Limosa lapponica baueri]
MPGARRSLASPVVSGVLCPCGSPRAAGTAPGPGAEGGSGGNASPCGRSVCEASEQDRRLRALFQKLDVNRDGALCIHDLAVGLGRLGLHRTELDLLQTGEAWCFSGLFGGDLCPICRMITNEGYRLTFVGRRCNFDLSLSILNVDVVPANSRQEFIRKICITLA